MRKNLLKTLVAGLALTVSAAFAGPAQDLFDQATFYLEFNYFGPSAVPVKDLVVKYQAELDKACGAAKDTCGYDKAEPIIAQMIEDLKDDHAYYQSAEDVLAERAQASGTAPSPSPRIGITHTGFATNKAGERGFLGTLSEQALTALNAGEIKLVSNDRLITTVLPNSPAEKAGVRPGDRFVGYNDTLFASQASVNDYAKFLEGFGASIRAGNTVKMNLVRGVGTDRKRLDISLKGEIVNLAPLPTMTILDNGVAVLKIGDFLGNGIGQRTHDLVREAQSKNVKAIILDMRGNGGGFAHERALAGGAFFEKPEALRRVPKFNADTQTIEEMYKDGKFVQVFNGRENSTGQSVQNPTLWKGPMAVLVDAGCASACEYMAAYFQRTKRAPVIGTPTVGIGNTNSQRFGLINGAAAAFPTVRAYWTDGTILPAQIKPDVQSETDLFTIFETGRDDGIAKALEAINIK